MSGSHSISNSLSPLQRLCYSFQAVPPPVDLESDSSSDWSTGTQPKDFPELPQITPLSPERPLPAFSRVNQAEMLFEMDDLEATQGDIEAAETLSGFSSFSSGLEDQSLAAVPSQQLQHDCDRFSCISSEQSTEPLVPSQALPSCSQTTETGDKTTATDTAYNLGLTFTEPGAETEVPPGILAWLREELAQAPEPDYLRLPPTQLLTQGHIIAIGDVHGDLLKLVHCFRMAGVAHYNAEKTRLVWVGGNTVVVQLGDVLDRGKHDLEAVMLLRELDHQAQLKGGAVVMINGNHEELNAAGDFRFVSSRDGETWGDKWATTVPASEQEQRKALFQRGTGRMALELAQNPTIVIVNDTLFVHGGLVPGNDEYFSTVEYGLSRLNLEMSLWLQAEGPICQAAYDVMWDRTFGDPMFKSLAFTGSLIGNNYASRLEGQLEGMLAAVGCKRMVIGHCIQGQINAVCHEKVWRVDVGMSCYHGWKPDRKPQALAIFKNGHVRPLPLSKESTVS